MECASTSSTSTVYISESSNEVGNFSSEMDDKTNSSNNFELGLSKDIIDEEAKSVTKTSIEKDKLKSQAVILDENEKEHYYKKLMVLLGKSTHYSNFILSRLMKVQKQDMELINSDKKSVSVEKKNLVTSSVPLKYEVNKENNDKVNRNKRPFGQDEKENASKKRKTKKNGLKNESRMETYINDSGLSVPIRQPKLLVGTVMRDYQLDGLEWLTALFENAVNGILADEMGLGKTIQVIALICHLFSKKIYGPFLIMAPLSTLPNWMLEFSNFAPKINTILYHGSEQKRNSLKIQFQKYLTLKSKHKLPIILTSYEIPLRDKSFFRKVPWCYVIVDEGHRLKNYRSLLSQELRLYSSENRLLLSGTPLQNNLTELWSLLNFLLPEIFNDLNMFESLFNFSDLEDVEKQNRIIENEKEQQLISKIHKILEPFLLRRLKSDVNILLPRKKELLVYTPLTSTQEELYKAVLDRSVDKIKGKSNKVDSPEIVNSKRKRKCTQNKSYTCDSDIEDDIENTSNMVTNVVEERSEDICNGNQTEYIYDIKLLNVSMQLRKIVNHPYLIQMPVKPNTKQPIIDEELIQKSGKFLVLDAMLPKLKERGHKVLLFSTFKIVLDLIEDYVIMRGYQFVRLDGNYAIEERMEMIKKFNSNPEVFIFLISTRAGGLGINLTSADTVIIYDSDWNPQVDLQAQDRCHRLGQVRPVVVYRLVTAGTVDEKIVERAAGKRRLEKLVVRQQKLKQNGKSETISITELKDLLQSTDYNKVFRSNGVVFTDNDLEDLLDRSDLIDDKDNATSNATSNTFKIIGRSVENTFLDRSDCS